MSGRPIPNEDIENGKVLVLGLNAEAQWDQCAFQVTRGKGCPNSGVSWSSDYRDFCESFIHETGGCSRTFRVVPKQEADHED